MSAVPLREPRPSSVSIDGADVVISNLRIADTDLLDLVQRAEDQAQAVTAATTLGARVVRMTQTTVDAAVVEARFADLEHRVEQGVTRAVNAIATTAERYLDPENGALKEMLDEVEKSIDETFDPTSKASVLAKFETLLTGGTVEIKKAVRDMVDPGNPESPMGRLRAEMSKEVTEVRQAVEQLAAKLAVEQAGAEVLELTAIKGRQFEEMVLEATASFASLYGDEASAVGDVGGSGGRRSGDIVVTLNTSDTHGAGACCVIEVKDRRLSLNEALRELERAISNRDAGAGLIVFSNQEKAPITVPLQVFGSKAIVVLDKHEPDPRALQLALIHARCLTLRQLNVPTDTADLKAVLALVEEGKRKLANHAAIKRCHTAAQNQIASAAGQVDGLVDGLDRILAEIATRLGQ
jgi:hypothetical protein